MKSRRTHTGEPEEVPGLCALGGAEEVAVWTTLTALRHTEDGITCLRYDREQFRIILQQHPPPPRWKPRHNDRVRLLCDADRFIGQLARLQQPKGSLREFSHKAEHS